MTATWISQAQFPSTTARTRERVAYLRPFAAQMERSIRGYFIKEPTGEQVTLAVLSELSEATVNRIADEHRKEFDTVKKDIGLYVAILLVKLYSDARVETYRDNKTMRNQTRSRSSRWSNLDWVSKYTPHRLVS